MVWHIPIGQSSTKFSMRLYDVYALLEEPAKKNLPTERWLAQCLEGEMKCEHLGYILHVDSGDDSIEIDVRTCASLN
jgi:hypothetical protein